jgi:hypothetical protein
MKAQYYRSGCTRGQVFTADLILALVVLAVGVTLASTMLMRQSASQVHLADLGSDVAARLAESGALVSLDQARISAVINETVPSSVNMNLYVSCRNSSILMGLQRPPDAIAAGGARFFVTRSEDCVARWQVWQ